MFRRKVSSTCIAINSLVGWITWDEFPWKLLTNDEMFFEFSFISMTELRYASQLTNIIVASIEKFRSVVMSKRKAHLTIRNLAVETHYFFANFTVILLQREESKNVMEKSSVESTGFSIYRTVNASSLCAKCFIRSNFIASTIDWFIVSIRSEIKCLSKCFVFVV